MRRKQAGSGVGPLGYVTSLFPPGPQAGVPGDAGLFGPGSEVWRIGRERALIAAGPAALLLQLSHPLVAAGVAEHSDFHADPLHRLRATLDATLTVVFGDAHQAHEAAARVRHRHGPVRGRTHSAVGRFPAGTGYRAGDPQLTLWVHTTLVWSALEFHHQFIAPLTLARRAGYQSEMNRFARLFGVPDALLPGSYQEFERYLRSMDADRVLEVGPQARSLASQLLDSGASELVWPLGGLTGALASVLAAGLLPPRIRAGYGLDWGWPERRAFSTARLICRTTLPALPPQARYWPHYPVARRRLR